MFHVGRRLVCQDNAQGTALANNHGGIDCEKAMIAGIVYLVAFIWHRNANDPEGSDEETSR